MGLGSSIAGAKWRMWPASITNERGAPSTPISARISSLIIDSVCAISCSFLGDARGRYRPVPMQEDPSPTCGGGSASLAWGGRDVKLNGPAGVVSGADEALCLI